MVLAALGMVALLALPLVANAYYLRLVTTVAMYVTLGMGLNVTVGQAGLLDMGYIGFFAVGAYARALLASPQLGIHLPFSLTLTVAMAAGILLSLVTGIPSLRLRGDYLAIVTMSFSEIIRILLLNLDRPVNITNGPNGIIQVDPVRVLGLSLDTPRANYYIILALAAVAYEAYRRMARSAIGLRWRAVRDDHIAASSLGVDVAKHRVLAFAVGSVYASVSGVFFASWQGAVFPQNFGLNELLTVYCMVILGGAGNPRGTVLGAAALTIVPELLRGYSVYRMLAYGLVLVLFTGFRPGGLLPAQSERYVPVKRAGAGSRKAGSRKHLHSGRPAAGVACPGPSPVFEARDVTCRFGGLCAVDKMNLRVWAGEVLSVIGPNGAGKTTLLNVMSGVASPTSGDCFLLGERITGLPPHAVYRRGLSRTFQNLRLFGNMTVAENILVGGGDDRLDPGSPLARLADAPAHSLDYASRKELEIARAVAAGPELLLLDEPAAGMGAGEAERLMVEIRRRKKAGKSVVLVEHQMDLVMRVSDRVIVMDHGRKIAEGTPSEVVADPQVRQVYLGLAGSEARGNQKPRKTRSSSRPLLELLGIKAAYGPVQALSGVDLRVWEGEAVCVLGANGAGKSTTLKTIMGGLRPAAGTIRFDGQDVTGDSARARRGMAFVPEGRRVFAGMTVEENLRVGASGSRSGGTDAGLYDVFALFPRLSERRTQLAGTLSGGEQQMLAIGRALMARPRLLLLDEPSMGLSPVAANAVFGALDGLRRRGVTILLVEQNASQALALADRGYLLRNGTVAAEGTPQDLAGGGDLQDAYLAADLIETQS